MPSRPSLSPMRLVWLVIGGLSLALGLVGIVLPVLPTTPFILLAAFAFGKSVPAFEKRLEESRLFGPSIRDWRDNGSIAPRAKRMAVAMMGLVFAISLALRVSGVVLAVQAVCLLGAATFILTRPNPRPRG